MTDAPLRPAPAPLRASEVYETFIALCVDTDGAFETACAAAAVRGFEPFDGEGPPRRDVTQVLAEARFRKPGFFFTAERHLADAPGRPSRRVQVCTLAARPASFRDLSATLAADLGSPTAISPAPGVEFVFIGDPRNTQRLASRADGQQRFERGEGDLVTINAFEVREHPTQPGDAIGLSYQRWSL